MTGHVSPRRTVVRLRNAVVAVVAVLATGCSLTATGDPSTAAVVEDREIPVTAIRDNLERIAGSPAFEQQARGDPEPLRREAQTQLVTAFVRSAALEEIAERNDIMIPDDAVDQVRQELVDQLGSEEELDRRLAEQGIGDDLFDMQLRDQRLQEAVQAELGPGADLGTFVRDELSDVDIQVNPRFGQWDTQSLAVQPYDPLAPEGDTTAATGQAPSPDDAP